MSLCYKSSRSGNTSRYRTFHPIRMVSLSSPCLEVLLRRRVRSALILAHVLPVFLTRVGLESLHIWAVHHACDLVGLPLFERKAGACVGVVFAVRLVLVVLDLGKVRVGGIRIEGEGDEGVDGGGFDATREGPRLGGEDRTSGGWT